MNETKQAILEAVSNGTDTSDAISEAVGTADGHTRNLLREMVKDGQLDRERDGRSYRYSLAKSAATAKTATTVSDYWNDLLDVEPADPDDFGVFGGDSPDRDYDWELYVPEPVRYVAADNEDAEIEAEIQSRLAIGKPARARIGGPTGCGKTTLAESIAGKNAWPMFTIQGSHALHPADVIGRMDLKDGETRWLDGDLTKALLASAERPVVLLLDEVNRARPQAKGTFFSALDHRAQLEIPATGEVIRGNPMNLIVISTMNEGTGYVVEDLDWAESRRLGPKWTVDYLGVNDPIAEAELVASKAPVPQDYAARLVTVANSIRDLATDEKSMVKRGVPTSEVIRWAQAAAAFDMNGIDNPTVRAGDAYIVRALFTKAPAQEEVRTVIESSLTDVPPRPPLDGEAEWGAPELDPVFDLPQSPLKCRECETTWTHDEAVEAGVIGDAWTCTECEGDVLALKDA